MDRLRVFVRKNYFVWVVAWSCCALTASVARVVAALADGVVSFWGSLKSSPKEYGFDLKMLSRGYFMKQQRLEPWRGKRFLNDGRRP